MHSNGLYCPDMQLIFHRPPSSVRIVIKNGALAQYQKRAIAIITDEHVGPLYAKKLATQTGAKVITIPVGEKQKTIGNAVKIAEQLLALGIDRSCMMIGLGGGVITDLTGFVASTLMRGIPFTLIPTSMLAMVDAAIGGKTGVNLREGKNLLGTFAQPQEIMIDPTVLQTLPERELRNGLAESIKAGVIGDAELFSLLEKNHDAVMECNPIVLQKIITQSIAVKARIVTKDENEKGVRMQLNYGHTLGHAIERASNFRIPHGFAVSMGICHANAMAVDKGLLQKNDAERIKKCLQLYGLPTAYRMTKKIAHFLQYDKKKKRGTLRWVLPVKIGKVIVMSS